MGYGDDPTPAGVIRETWRWFPAWVVLLFVALLLIGGVTYAGSQFGWWLSAQNATHQAQNIQNGYSNQTSIRQEITADFATLSQIGTQIAASEGDKPLVTALDTQRAAVAAKACAEAAPGQRHPAAAAAGRVGSRELHRRHPLHPVTRLHHRSTVTMNRTKIFTTAGAFAGSAVLAVSLTACTQSQPAGQAQENSAQQADQAALEAAQPIPHYGYSQIRQTLIDAETISANGTQTTSFFFQMGAADPVYSCPSLGMPVPNTASLSNPQQVVPDPNASSGSEVVGQMDPDGIYQPPSSEGTYVICLSSSGAKYLDYWEGQVLTVSGAAEWDKASHSMKVIGAPTAAVHTAPAAAKTGK